MKTGIRMLGLCGLWAASCAWGGGCPQVETPERLWFDIPAQTLQRDLPVGSVVWQGRVRCSNLHRWRPVTALAMLASICWGVTAG